MDRRWRVKGAWLGVEGVVSGWRDTRSTQSIWLMGIYVLYIIHCLIQCIELNILKTRACLQTSVFSYVSFQ